MTPTPEMIAIAERIVDNNTAYDPSDYEWSRCLAVALTAIMETSKKHLQMITNLPTGATEDVTQGHEDCYRLIEATFTEPPKIVCKPSATGSI